MRKLPLWSLQVKMSSMELINKIERQMRVLFLFITIYQIQNLLFAKLNVKLILLLKMTIF